MGGAFKGSFKLIGKLPRVILGIGKSIGKTLLNVGKRLGKAFLSVGKGLFNFVRRLLGRLRIPGYRPPTPKGKTPPRPKGKGPTPKGKTTPKPKGKGPTPKAPKSPKVRPKPLTSVNKFLKKIFGIADPKDVKKLKDASPVLKKGGNFLKGARIPVVGPLIVFALTALDPDPESGGIVRGLFKAIGTGLGEFLGFGIPIPILGPIIGGLVGEVMGDAAYELIINKDSAAAGKKIMDAVTATGEFFGPILDWGKGVVAKFFDSLPKIKLPFGGPEVINPLALVPPMLITEVPKALMNAFFGKPTEKGEVKEIDDPNKLTGVTNMSTVTTVKPERAGDFVVNSDGQLRVFDGQGYAGATPEQQKLYESGATNIDGSRASVPTTSNAGYWGPLLETIAKKESVGGSYDSIYPGTTKQKRYGGKALTEMTIQAEMASIAQVKEDPLQQEDISSCIF